MTLNLLPAGNRLVRVAQRVSVLIRFLLLAPCSLRLLQHPLCKGKGFPGYGITGKHAGQFTYPVLFIKQGYLGLGPCVAQALFNPEMLIRF